MQAAIHDNAPPTLPHDALVAAELAAEVALAPEVEATAEERLWPLQRSCRVTWEDGFSVRVDALNKRYFARKDRRGEALLLGRRHAEATAIGLGGGVLLCGSADSRPPNVAG